jgi:hypothetical protein
MAEWCKTPCEFGLTKDGQYYQAVGTEDNLYKIHAIWVTYALDKIRIMKDNKAKGIRFCYCKIVGDLRAKEDINAKYIKLPCELDFQFTVFEGEVDFSFVHFKNNVTFLHNCFKKGVDFDNTVWFGEETTFGGSRFRELVSFEKAQFKNNVYFINAYFEKDVGFDNTQFEKNVSFEKAQFGEYASFVGANFRLPADFSRIKYWSDSPRVTVARWLWKNGKILSRILPKNSPEGKLPDFYFGEYEGTQFRLDSRNIDETSNPHFKRYVADQQYLRSLQGNYHIVHWLWRWSSNCGRSIGLWALWLMLAIIIFWLIYLFGFNNCFVFTNEQLGKTLQWSDYLYYTVVTFTTLGFGDIVPSQPLAKFVVALEVLIGYVMLGILIGIGLNKIARRS